MFSLLLCAQLAGAVAPDSVYATPALRDMVSRAAEANRNPPAEFRSYTSRIETELAMLVRDTLGREHTAELEQLATNATWTRDGRYDLHIVGYRSQSAGVPYSMLSIVRGWTVPSLYGNRLSFGAYFNRTLGRGDSLTAVHPFAPDRDEYYRFSGGDTVTVLRVGARRIPIARIHVHPHFNGPTRLAAFDGEIDVDAERDQIVRMRGQIVTLGEPPSLTRRIVRAAGGIIAVAYTEFVNAEVDGRYWLPAFQRTEFQASFALLGQTRPVFRIVSNIDNVVVRDSAPDPFSDSLLAPRMIVSWAPEDSISQYGAWRRGMGSQSGSVHADDFDDLAPDIWRSTGRPRLNVFPTNTAKIFRFNRVEGLFAGVAPSVDFRDLAPGLTAGADVGWAWTEQTARGGAFVSYKTGASTIGARAERVLETTTDFAMALSEDPGFGALLGSIDPYDYVDRRRAVLSLTRTPSAVSAGLATLQVGVASDRAEPARLTHGPLSTRRFRPNLVAINGTYALAVADLELHPNVTGDFVQPGVGLRAHYEAGSGDLHWQRVELGLAVRHYLGPISFAAHADAGAVIGRDPPPQRIFELGGDQTLPGYDFDRFKGDYAALLRSFASYRFPLWERPLRVWRNVFLPGVSPGVAASAQGGWTDLSTRARSTADSLLETTHGVRATVGAGLTFFSDVLHVGLARPVDRPAPWRLVIGFGATF